MIEIYDNSGDLRFITPVNKGSKRHYKLMGDDYITLNFSTAGPVRFKIGDYCDIDNAGRFVLSKPYQPERNAAGGYDYELRLDAQILLFKTKILRFMPGAKGGECNWVLTGTIDTHISQILQNIDYFCSQSDAYKYRGKDMWRYFVDGTVDLSAKTITYDSTNIIDAITQIAETFECEWWVTDNCINFGKCELSNDFIDFEVGVNVAEISRSDSSENYVTRIIPFGSERNISPRYRRDLIFQVTDIYEGGNIISDSARALRGSWFPAENTGDSLSPEIVGAGMQSKRSAIAGTSQLSFVLFYNDAVSFDISCRKCLFHFELFRPSIDFSDVRGELTRIKCQLTIAFYDAGGKTYTTVMEHIQPITATELTYSPEFENKTLEIPSECSRVSVSASFFVEISEGGNATALVYGSGTDLTISIQQYAEYLKASRLTIQKIDGDGNITDEYNGAEYNPNGTENISDANRIKLPYGKTMSVGDRYFIKEILLYKVKSSYFSDRYTIYSDYEDIVKNGIVTRRLMLPESYGKYYVDYRDGVGIEESVEDVVVFEDIYPRTDCNVTGVTTFDAKETVQNDDGTETERTYTAYKITDDFFTAENPFSNDYRLNGVELQIVFGDGRRYKEGDEIPDGKHIGELVNPESGKLNGWTFNVNFHKNDDGSAVWEIIRDSESYVPNDVIYPCIGDTFVLTGFDISAVDKLCVEKAEQELLVKSRQYLDKLNIDPSTYECTMMSDVIKNGGLFQLGSRVNLLNDASIERITDDNGRQWGRKSRIIGFEYNLDIPYDNPVFTVGEKAAYSKFGAIEDSIDALKYAMNKPAGSTSTISGGASNPYYVITSDDNTTRVSDRNVFSALRSRLEFTMRNAGEIINNIWNFAQGLSIGNFRRGENGAYISPGGSAEFEDMTARGDINADNADIDGDVNAKNANISNNAIIGGNVTSDGFYTPNFVPGATDGMGAALYDKDGEGYAELDYLKVRKGLVVTKIVVNEIKSVGGVMVVSPANGTVDYVEEDEDGRITIWLKEDNMFLIGDLVRWGNWDAHNQVLRAGWCQVRQSDSAERCFVIYRSDMNEYMTLPAADDALVLMGNVQDRLRQGFVIIDSSEGEPHISAYSEVSSRTLTADMLKARFGSLENLNTEQWGLLSGYGIMSQNAYLTGDLLIRSTSTKASDLIVSTVNVYYQNGSMTVAPEKPADINNLNGWSEEMPEYRKGMFIWQCSVIRRANGNIEISDPFCISGKDGEDTVNVEIYTDNGNVILNGQGEITLTARVYRGSDDITDSISPAYFSWERTSTYPQGDENWNLRHKGCGNVITVTKDDITVRANFDCIVNI